LRKNLCFKQNPKKVLKGLFYFQEKRLKYSEKDTKKERIHIKVDESP